MIPSLQERGNERSVNMFCKAYSATVYGIEGLIVSVEADISDGLPIFDMVGYLGSEVKEARERVKIALKNCGYRLPAKRITVNLSPADIRKQGTAFDLPIAIAILAAFGHLPPENLKDVLIIGELSLNGSINKVNGVLPIVYSARQQGYKKCIVPKDNAREGAVVGNIETYGAANLTEAIALLSGEIEFKPEYIDINKVLNGDESTDTIDFSEVSGQLAAKRAIEIAASGMHNMLMIGPPGSGKTMLARRIPTIMPRLSFDESMEISKIYSIAGLMGNHALITKRPFRAPHHTITTAALTGGGHIPHPGEISLAHLGVLFLDELPEFQKNTIEVLRQPLEDKSVTVSRLHATYHYPAGFMLIGAMNPCNCGYYPDRNKCYCSVNQVKRYLNRISQPLLDRFDICIEALQINYTELENKKSGESSAEIRKRVSIARDIQMERYKEQNIYFNSGLTPKTIKKYCKLGDREKALIEQAFIKMNLSARAYHRILKVARTIADLDQSEKITTKHISEAICYRSNDQKYWGD
jgi:magnesium chelatase family protein